MRKIGVEVQTYGYAADGTPVYAGVHFVPEISARWLYRLHRHWQAWRKWYDNLPENRRRDYPAKRNPVVAITQACPVGRPEQVKWLRVA